jgi:hypothetical protein
MIEYIPILIFLISIIYLSIFVYELTIKYNSAKDENLYLQNVVKVMDTELLVLRNALENLKDENRTLRHTFR